MNMKHFIATTFFFASTLFAWGQTGTVHQYHDVALDKLLSKDKESSTNAITSTGYRIQVYSSNVAKKAKNSAFNIKNKLKNEFPEHRAYVEYQAPFWKVRYGDFTNYADAVICSNQLKEAFPKLAGEIIIVKEKKVKPIYFGDITETENINEEGFPQEEGIEEKSE